MKKILPVWALLSLLALSSQGQTFTENVMPFADLFNSGGCVGVVDMNQDGYDDVVIFDQSKELYIQYQLSDGSFIQEYYGVVSGSNQWGFSVGDYGQDGHNDVFSGGAYDEAHFISIDGMGEFEVVEVADDSFFMQGCSTSDIDGDMWLDVFGCHDDAESKIWGNNGMGGLIPQNDWIDMATVPESDNSGNYGSVFCDVDNDGDTDLYIAKCRQGVTDPNDPRRINALFINDGEGNYTEDADARGLAPLHQSWTSDFADIDNDGDFDCLLTNHDTSLKLFENDGSGYFTNITEGSGLEDETGFFLQAKMEDFDNDGFVDLFYAGDIEAYFHNNGDGTFTKFEDKLPNTDVLHSFAFGDLNKDGWIDLYASYGNGYVNPDMAHPDKMWMNDGGDNNWVTITLQGTESNNNAIGSRVSIYGDWGVQIREVRSGESYGIVNSFSCHFGLGEAEAITQLVVDWPSGDQTTMDNPDINTFIEIIEGCDVLPEASIEANGATVLCNDESVILELNSEASNVMWSTGETGSSIEVNESGVYYAEVWDDEMCIATTNNIFVDVYEPQIPTITIENGPTLCEGDAVVLTASEGLAYDWNDGGDDMINEVTESGEYWVTVTDECENELTSEWIVLELEFLPVPSTPDAVPEQNIANGATATFNVAEENARWFAGEFDETHIASGSTYTTPALFETTSYWVGYFNGEESIEATGGKEEQGDDGQYHDNAGYWNVFTAHEDIIIAQVTVYTGNAGDRYIYVEDEAGQVVAEGTFYMPEGESDVAVNFAIPAGENYAFKASGNHQMWRDSSDEDLPYPYEIGDLASITGTNITSNNWDNYYYYFYDWVVMDNPWACVGERVEAVANVAVSVEEIEYLTDFTVYPNPTADVLNVTFTSMEQVAANLEVLNGLGQKVMQVQQNVQVGENRLQMDLSTLSRGIYYLNIWMDGQAVSRKVVVE